jgi:hypothetical protein
MDPFQEKRNTPKGKQNREKGHYAEDSHPPSPPADGEALMNSGGV